MRNDLGSLPKLCVTGRERSPTALASRLERFRAEPVLQEVRIDALETFDSQVFELLGKYSDQVVACCRPKRQGGWFEGGESDRLDILRGAASSGVRLIDLEFDVPGRFIEELRRSESKLLLSFHDFTGPQHGFTSTLQEMDRKDVHAIKVAVHTEDAADLQLLRDIQSTKPMVLVGMGTAGLLSRVLFDRFGSLFTYVSADGEEGTAAGQFSWEEARAYGVPLPPSAPFYVLLGGDQVSSSPGARVYNRLFRARSIPGSYIPVPTRRLGEMVKILRQLGCAGASVTMPHKQEAFRLSVPDQAALESGAANTLRFDGGLIESTNTDIEGIRRPLQDAIAVRNLRTSTAMVLGGGGAARAAVLACQSLNLKTVVAARSFDPAGLSVSWIPWAERTSEQAGVLINATPIADDKTLWPDDMPLNAEIVFDLAIGEAPSGLLARARAEGAVAIAGSEMWITQGALQMTWLTGTRITTESLRELMS